jgi:hypothetical protein
MHFAQRPKNSAVRLLKLQSDRVLQDGKGFANIRLPVNSTVRVLL